MNLTARLSRDYLSRLKGLELKARTVLEGTLAGRHASPFHGYSSEFSQFRGYTPGDDLRHFDWKAYARSGKPLIRQYRDETNAALHLILDTSASMTYAGAKGGSKLEYAALLAASLALLAHRRRDPVALVLGAAQPQAILPPRSSASHLQQVFRALEDPAIPAGATDLSLLYRRSAPLLRRGSFTFLFTDLWQEAGAVLAGVKNLLSRRQDLTLVCVLAEEEKTFLSGNNLELTDLEDGTKLRLSADQLRGEFTALMGEHRARIRNECRDRRIGYVEVSTAEPAHRSLRQVLAGRG